jgi:RNA polymerase sigma-70 factor (ECF subfamily)
VAVSEATLVGRVAVGDVAALRQLYARHARTVYVMAAHSVGPTAAEEVVQDVFVTLWRRAGRFDPARGSLSAWLMAIARHRVLDELASRRRQPEPVEDIERLLAAAPASAPAPEEHAERSERGQAVRRALRALPAEQRQVLVLAYFGGLSQAEMARRLGVPLGTVKKRVRLGLRKLRASLVGEPAVDIEERQRITR